MNQIVPIQASNVEAYRASTDAAALCKEIVVASALTIQGRKYVRVEGWQAIALAHGCTGSARDVETVDGGIRATGEIRRMSDGAVIAEAEGFVGEDEPTWFGGKVGSKTLPKRPDYAIRAMAQTRAISRACRSAFAHVVVMMNAGLSTTPAEEVPDGGFHDEPREPMRDVSPRGSASEPTAAVTAANAAINMCNTSAELKAWWEDHKDQVNGLPDPEYVQVSATMRAKTAELKGKACTKPAPQPEAAMAIGDDDIPGTFK